MSKESLALSRVDEEFRSLVKQALELNLSGAPVSTNGFVGAVRELEKLLSEREATENRDTVPIEELRKEVERKKILLEKHKGDLARWKAELENAVKDAEQVLLGPKK
jgi:hypothetical protein